MSMMSLLPKRALTTALNSTVFPAENHPASTTPGGLVLSFHYKQAIPKPNTKTQPYGH